MTTKKLWNYIGPDDINSVDWEKFYTPGDVITQSTNWVFGASADEIRTFIQRSLESNYVFEADVNSLNLVYKGRRADASESITGEDVHALREAYSTEPKTQPTEGKSNVEPTAETPAPSNEPLHYLVEGDDKAGYSTLDEAVASARKRLIGGNVNGNQLHIFKAVARISIGEPTVKVVKLKETPESSSKDDDKSKSEASGQQSEPAPAPANGPANPAQGAASLGTGWPLGW
ncbi:MAG: hypothetical protein GF334_02705 [Candidatus Altiarchaeales archaeon]|nr:hypothetical protein [Candidatus Altiarchaeales archaeon]